MRTRLTILAIIAALAGLSAASLRPPDEMVLVDGGRYEPLYESPTDTAGVDVDPFYLDRHPVTNAEFLEFVAENAEWRRSRIRGLFADTGYLGYWESDLDFGADSLANRPVVNVSWFAAMAYAKWVGKRLPTTAEWEIAAAAGIDTPAAGDDSGFKQQILAWYSEPTPDVHAPVGSTPANYWGIHDLHGLVWEWVMDFNTALVTGESRNNTDLDRKLFCGSGSVGASGFTDYAAFIRFAFRSGLDADYTVSNLGFRCARDAKPTTAS